MIMIVTIHVFWMNYMAVIYSKTIFYMKGRMIFAFVYLSDFSTVIYVYFSISKNVLFYLDWIFWIIY